MPNELVTEIIEFINGSVDNIICGRAERIEAKFGTRAIGVTILLYSRKEDEQD